MTPVEYLEKLHKDTFSLSYGKKDELGKCISHTELAIKKLFGVDSDYIRKLKDISFDSLWNEKDPKGILIVHNKGVVKLRDLIELMIADLTLEKASEKSTQTPKSEKPFIIEKTNRISLATRRNILDGFLVTRILWFGSLDQPGFLGRLYDLSKYPSYDARYKSADEDIYKHTVLNDDWPADWIFTDSRFNLLHCSDKEFLDFLCLTIHPTVRDNSEELTTLLEIYNNNLKRDGYLLVKTSEIAKKPVYSAERNITPENVKAEISISDKAETKHALVVGCSKYLNDPLVNPLNDAQSMEKFLKELGFTVLLSIDPTQKALKQTIDSFGLQLKGQDIALFYFAGHGVQVKGQNYLVPIDANLTSEKLVEYDCIEASRILAHMEDARTKVNLMILDACRNNPFERSWGRGIGQRGLASMNAPKGSLIAYSTSPGTTASDGDGANGLYTEALLNHIRRKGTPINTMFQKVRLEVMEKSKEQQVPWESTSLTADFYFNK
jgi:hypothetical protein